MARLRNPERKPALLAEIVEFLLDKPLSGLTFRTLADGLGVSTYTLVYHFGSRAELVRQIVQAVSERQTIVVTAVANELGDIETHLDNIRRSWELSLIPRNMQLQRLEFEAAMLEAREPDRDGIAVTLFDRWHRAGVEALVRMGVAPADAELETRVIVDTAYGLQYDLIVTRDIERVSEAFVRFLEGYERRILALLDADLLDEVS